jgi:hypothetical protein
MPESIFNNLELTAINAATVGTHSQTMRAAELKEMQKMGWITEETVTSFVDASRVITNNQGYFSLPFSERLELAVAKVKIFIEVISTEFELEGKYRAELEKLHSDFAFTPNLKPMESAPSPNHDTESLKRWIRELEQQEATIRHGITSTLDLTERQGLTQELIALQKEQVLAERDVFLAERKAKVEVIELAIARKQQRLRQATESLEIRNFLDELITGSIKRSISLNDSLGGLRLALAESEFAGLKARHKRELEELGFSSFV